jgi:hypothetical protein
MVVGLVLTSTTTALSYSHRRVSQRLIDTSSAPWSCPREPRCRPSSPDERWKHRLAMAGVWSVPDRMARWSRAHVLIAPWQSPIRWSKAAATWRRSSAVCWHFSPRSWTRRRSQIWRVGPSCRRVRVSGSWAGARVWGFLVGWIARSKPSCHDFPFFHSFYFLFFPSRFNLNLNFKSNLC